MASNSFTIQNAGAAMSRPDSVAPSFGLALSAVIGAALVHAVNYTGFLLLDIYIEPRTGQASGSVLLTLVLSIGVSACVLPKTIDLIHGGINAPPPRRVAAFLPLAAIFLTAILFHMQGFAAWEGGFLRLHLALVGHGIITCAMIMLFFAAIPPGRRGVWYGCGISMGFLLWDILQSLIRREQDEAAAKEWFNLLWEIHNAVFIFLALVTVYGFAKLRPAHPAVMPAPARPKPGRMLRLTGTLFLFYLANGFMQSKLMPTGPNRDNNPEFWQLHLLIIIACPLFGLFLDRRRNGTKTLILICSVFLMLAPTLNALNHAPLIYLTILAIASLAQFAMLITAILAIADLGTTVCCYGAAYFVQLFLRLVSVFGYFLCREISWLDEGITVLLATAAAIGCHLMAWRLDDDDEPVMGMAGVMPAFREEESPEDEEMGIREKRLDSPEEPVVDGISLRCREYNLTPRECDVARLLATGRSLTEISQLLHISEYTAKTHLRNIMSKFAVSNRSVLLIKLLQ